MFAVKLKSKFLSAIIWLLLVADTSLFAQTESDSWIEKLIVYTATPGSKKYDPEKYFTSGNIENQENKNHKLKLFAEAFNIFSQYQKSEFPNGKSEKLKKIDEQLRNKLDSFKKELIRQANMYIMQAEREIRSAVSRLAKNFSLKGNAQPVVLPDYVFYSIRQKIRRAKNVFSGDARIDNLMNQLDALQNEQRKWREKNIENIVMLPDKFIGNDSKKIKLKTKSVLRQKYFGAQVLRVNIINPDWEEESVIEFSDSTQSSVEYRVTRNITVQVAASYRGDCFLYSVHIAKDRLSTGGWTDLYGHIMFIDKILEENVNK